MASTTRLYTFFCKKFSRVSFSHFSLGKIKWKFDEIFICATLAFNDNLPSVYYFEFNLMFFSLSFSSSIFLSYSLSRMHSEKCFRCRKTENVKNNAFPLSTSSGIPHSTSHFSLVELFLLKALRT